MRGAILATAAALAGTAMADVAHMRRHGHDSFHQRRSPLAEADATCGCTTEVVTVWGPPTLIPVASPTPSTVTSEAVTTLHSTSTTTVTVIASASTPAASPSPATDKVPLPTPAITNFPSTGVYTIPATTVTVFDTTTVCGATTTELPAGTHTYGGVTTVVETATTVVCPYATVEPSGTTVTSVIKTTTYVCPSAGTYTIAPTTTTVPTSTVIVYPTPAVITPGTYTQPEQTVTVTRTDYTYVCPFTGQDEPTSAPAAPSTTAVPATTTAAPETTTAVPSTSSAAPSSSSTAPASTGAVSGQMGMTYTPYTKGGDCKDKSSVLSEVAALKSKGFTHVRVYSTDCNSLEYIGEAARTSGLQMIIGVFISSTGVSGAQDQVTAISKWAQWDLVSLIVVGNEAIQNGYCDASTLAGFISSAKSAFQAAGYTGKVTTTEPINVWQAHGSTLCGVCDIVGANIHPFFNADVSADQAGKFVAQEIKVLESICPGKDVLNLETGWPHAGNANGKAVPGTSEQAIAIKSIADEVGSKSVFFSYFDDLWKEPGQFGVERYWGCFDTFN
ncbi:hypothetical protein KXW98_006847 [Aspergillus fumigatus]|nr:hypothetical protein CNMCM8812_005910 [Aspergillus fumigatus]KAH1274017.1 hypothetical protein KXX45_007613 [Aspergillus fumigatus]KAH1292169.1 hypothetical protein KXX48_006631 [Aspergillus fumigatus]KAH1310538.1 hypothetical protein KXX66_008968 [Aspergillus fumigatus]KAH1342119.1 hypothetical protein KXX67_006742 [Aspergillus fumigatus]